MVYVVLSGVSPFLDDSLDETCSNIVRRDFCFPHEYFSGISGDAKDFISMLLVFDIRQVLSVWYCIFLCLRSLYFSGGIMFLHCLSPAIGISFALQE